MVFSCLGCGPPRLADVGTVSSGLLPVSNATLFNDVDAPKPVAERASLPPKPFIDKFAIPLSETVVPMPVTVSAMAPKAMRSGHTSGTTGTPLTVAYDRDTVWMTYAVFDRHYEWARLRMGRDGDRSKGSVTVNVEPRPRFDRAL